MSAAQFDPAHWQVRLDKLRQAHHVPGASLAVLVDGEVHELSSGVLHRGTGVAVTPDSVFLAGSVAKAYTATLVMQLVDAGRLDLDTPAVTVLPEFGTPDPVATERITVRQLLSHTAGVTNDFNHDTGRGDDCLERYVAAARDVPLDLSPGLAFSYGSLGYVVLARIVEVLTGQTWDDALRQRLFEPLGLERSMTLPEEALRFRVAMGHLGMPGVDPDPAPEWDMMPRSAGPYGRVIVSAGDLVSFGRMHLNGGVAPNGTRILSTSAVAAMQRPEVDVPDKWSMSSDTWGLGWTLYDWDGIPGYGHDGSAVSQEAFLRIVPSAGVVAALTTNGGGCRPLYAALFRELLASVAGVRVPDDFGPPATPVTVDLTPHLGQYKREGVLITVSERNDKPYLTYEFVDGMQDLAPPLEGDLIPVSATDTATVCAAQVAGPGYSAPNMPVVFTTLSDGRPYCYASLRAAPKIA